MLELTATTPDLPPEPNTGGSYRRDPLTGQLTRTPPDPAPEPAPAPTHQE